MTPIRYRLRWRQLPWYLPALYAALLVLTRNGDRAALGGGLVVLSWTVAIGRAVGADLWPDTLVVRRPGRTTTVPWNEVHSIAADAHAVRVVTARGTWTLAAPVHHRLVAPDPGFVTKAAEIQRYWVEHRGPDWTPPPAPVWPAAASAEA
jgi:hypothetical protein